MRWAAQKSRTVFATCGRAISCWKLAPGMLWRKGTVSGSSKSRTYLMVLSLPSILSKLDPPLYKIASQAITLGIRPLFCSMTNSGRKRWPAERLTGTPPSLSHKLKHDSSEKIAWCQPAVQADWWLMNNR